MLGAAALDWPGPPARAASQSILELAFFDRRFERARQIAASWPASTGPVAVLGDITPWADTLMSASARVLRVRGVTTESFRFCAAILAGERADVDLQVSKIDQDLVVWTMRATRGRKVEQHHV